MNPDGGGQGGVEEHSNMFFISGFSIGREREKGLGKMKENKIFFFIRVGNNTV